MFTDFLANSYCLDKKMWETLEATVNSIKWPSGIGRLPTNVRNPYLTGMTSLIACYTSTQLAENHSLAKADQWRRWANIQCTVLWICWRNQYDRIRTCPPDVPAGAKKQPTFNRTSLPAIYDIFLKTLIVERTLAAKSISMEDVNRGHGYLVHDVCQAMLRLGVHLVPNHHLAMHYPRIFRLGGPAYAWWLYAQERFNGEQETVNHNGHAGGEMELTLLRNWVAKHRLYELVCMIITSLPY